MSSRLCGFVADCGITRRVRCGVPTLLTMLAMASIAVVLLTSATAPRASPARENRGVHSTNYFRVFRGTDEEERRMFNERDMQMFRHVFSWLETVSYQCEDLSLLGGSSEVDMLHDLTPGASWACFDPPLSLSSLAASNDTSATCRALSFGVHDGLPLELALAALGCHVHAVDPRYPHIFRTLPDRLHFYALRLGRRRVAGPSSSSSSSPETDGSSGSVADVAPEKRNITAQAPLDAFITNLVPASQPVNYLQLDINGDEAGVLLQQLFDNGEGVLVLDRVLQMAITFHLSSDLRHYESLLTFDVYDMAFRRLDALGFRVAHSQCVGERRLLYPAVKGAVCGQYRVLLVKVGHDVWDRLERGNVPIRLEFMSKRFD